jgi:protein gp37
MSDGSHIEWTDATWNPITGCSVYSAGCTNCYAMKLAGTRLAEHPSRVDLTKSTKAGPVWTGEVRFNEYWLDQPLHWRKPRRVFFVAHGDAFHDAVQDRWLDLCFAVMAMSPRHQFQVLTKRAAGMRAYFEGLRSRADQILKTIMGNWTGLSLEEATAVVEALIDPAGLPNVWLGVSCEHQAAADERVADLLAIPAAVHWVSYEPALGPINWRSLDPGNAGFSSIGQRLDALGGLIIRADGAEVCEARGRLDWIVAGGESGPDARPSHPEWYRRTAIDCAETGVAFLFKQWGNWEPVILPDGSAIALSSIGRGKTPEVTVPTGVEPPVFRSKWAMVVGMDGPDTMKSPVALMERLSKKSPVALLDGEQHLAYPVELSNG